MTVSDTLEELSHQAYVNFQMTLEWSGSAKVVGEIYPQTTRDTLGRRATALAQKFDFGEYDAQDNQ